MSSLAISFIAIGVALLVGRLSERARHEHGMFMHYRGGAVTNLAGWLKDTVKTLIITIGLVLLLIYIVMH